MESTPPGMLARAAGVLSAFDAHNRTLTQSDIGRRTGLPLPTVHRICAELARLGALEKIDGARYQVGVRLWEIGSLAPRSHGLREIALPVMEDLYESTHENVQLVVREGLEALYIERISGRDAVRLKGRAGGRLPIHASSGGLVLLAHGGPTLLADVLDAGPQRLTENTVVSEHGLRNLLDAIRRNDFVVCNKFLDDVTVAIAAPLRNAEGAVVAAMSVALSATTDHRPLVPALRTAARTVSRLLSSR
ncbi:IclR family transcriptional regulator [Rhodococcus fascians]|uniref:IclR family transcriptional regulator n=1 Tax=Rhodococcoides fascians TaxID=1828 RepID=UPI001961D601|nr:IclR family transcriptional regulator [Rhodococcus fascians]MBM7244427.1 IclR family transcriptional regulator [Rhodococcus fascians]MBY3808047.1 IclR family transcriptional regulator [Rhodococcus fascians]MBY3839595.1 IclR family transcriptional regulator [Rhodococcus fascians]MBY3847858.1 IclR family transcriptional regulator [Rhodococcus fascians]MBY3851350.1 IclR family transcriptional regulator [Rhodococcus fascians]